MTQSEQPMNAAPAPPARSAEQKAAFAAGQYSNLRWKWGVIAVAVGAAALVGAFILVALKWRQDQGVAALGVVASPVVSIVAAYFGIQSSAEASTAAQQTVHAAQQSVQTAQAHAIAAEREKTKLVADLAHAVSGLSPAVGQQVMEGLPSLRQM